MKTGTARCGTVFFPKERYGAERRCTEWYGMIRYGMTRYEKRYGTTTQHVIRYDTVRGTVRHDYTTHDTVDDGDDDDDDGDDDRVDFVE